MIANMRTLVIESSSSGDGASAIENDSDPDSFFDQLPQLSAFADYFTFI